jgi:hypothetical protein
MLKPEPKNETAIGNSEKTNSSLVAIYRQKVKVIIANLLL